MQCCLKTDTNLQFLKICLNVIAINFANNFSINLYFCILSNPNVTRVLQSPLGVCSKMPGHTGMHRNNEKKKYKKLF